MKILKTSQKIRNTYNYYDCNGNKVTITPGFEGVTVADIETLHVFDDQEVDNNRRETRRHESLDDCNYKHVGLEDKRVNVEKTVLDKLDYNYKKNLVSKALTKLTQDEVDLINALYLSSQPMSQAEYASKLGIKEDSVKKKALRARQKLKSIIEEKHKE